MWQFVFDRKTIANVEMCYNLFLALLDLKFISGHLLIPVFSFHFQVEISNILYDFHSKLPIFSKFEVEIYDFSGDFHSKLTYKDFSKRSSKTTTCWKTLLCFVGTSPQVVTSV